jgi:GT2 family glycosyltransferase
VVSLTWNSERYVPEYLTTLFADASASGMSVEVLVVDNGSQDGTLGQLALWQDKHAELRVLRQTSNRGTTVSRNLALREVRGDYVLVVDSDTRIPPGTLRGLKEGFDQLAATTPLGLLCPKLTYPNGDAQESARRFPTVFTKGLRLLRWETLRRWEESIPAVLAGQATPVDYAISAAWFFKRSLLDEVGLLDEKIFYAPEDTDYCARVWARGKEVWYYPSVTVIHDCQRMTNKKPFSKMGMSHASGLFYYWRKHGGMVLRRRQVGATRSG